MKKILTTIFLVLIVSGSLLPSITLAQEITPDGPEVILDITQRTNAIRERQAELEQLEGSTNPDDINRAEELRKEIADLQDQQNRAIDTGTAAAATPQEDDGACWSWTAGIQVGNCIRLVVAGVGEVIVRMVSIVLILVNELFNVVVQISIRDFASYANQDGVNNAWKAVRDVVNIAFIFILLYVAIGAMFQLFSAKKLLVKVIIIALLINFSALVPKIVIDASNLLALEFYDRMGDGETYTGAPAVTHAIVSGLGLWDNADSFWDRVKASEDEGIPDPLIGKLSILGIIGAIYGKIALILVTSFVLAMAAWLFIVRTVVLLFLIILSPIAFIAAVLPKTESLFKKWLNKLFSEAFFAPAYLFLMYVVISIVKGTNLAESVGTTDGNIFASTDVIKVLLNFVIIIIMMGAAITIAKQMGAQAGGTVAGWAGKAKGFGLGLLGRASYGALGAYSLGKLGKKIADADWLDEAAAKSTWRGGGLARFAQGAANKVAGQRFGAASYDQRVEKKASRIEGFKTPELQSQYLASLSQVDREAAFKKLSDRQKSILVNEAKGIKNDLDPRKRAIEGLESTLSREEREKMEKSGNDAEKQKGEAIARINTERAIQLLTDGKRRKIEGYEKNLAGEEDKSRPIYAKHKDKGYENQYVYEDADGKDLPAIKSGEQPISQENLMGRLETEQIAKIIKDVPIGSAGKLKKILDVRDKDNNNIIIESKNKVAKMVVQNMHKNQLLKLFEKDADLKDDQIEVINQALNDRDARIPQKIKENIERLQKAVASNPKAKSLGIEIT